MDELPIPETPEKESPRWIQVLLGVVLALLTLLCGFASAELLVFPNEKGPVLSIVIGLILLLGCLWTLEKCFRLITGCKNQGGLMAPNALRVVSFFCLAPPVAGLFTGYYRKMGLVAIISSSDVFLRLSGASCVGSKARGNGGSDGRTKRDCR